MMTILVHELVGSNRTLEHPLKARRGNLRGSIAYNYQAYRFTKETCQVTLESDSCDWSLWPPPLRTRGFQAIITLPA